MVLFRAGDAAHLPSTKAGSCVGCAPAKPEGCGESCDRSMKAGLERVAEGGNGIFGLKEQEVLGRGDSRAPWCLHHSSTLRNKPGK